MDAVLAAAPTDDAWRKAVADSLKELVTATQALARQNAEMVATYAAHHEDTQRRLEALERHDEAQVEHALQASTAAASQEDGGSRASAGAWLNRLYGDWRMVTLVGMAILNVVQLVGGHMTWHW